MFAGIEGIGSDHDLSILFFYLLYEIDTIWTLKVESCYSRITKPRLVGIPEN